MKKAMSTAYQDIVEKFNKPLLVSENKTECLWTATRLNTGNLNKKKPATNLLCLEEDKLNLLICDLGLSKPVSARACCTTDMLFALSEGCIMQFCTYMPAYSLTIYIIMYVYLWSNHLMYEASTSYTVV